MGKPVARIGNMHVCPMVTPGLPPVPHVGGPVTGPGAPTVLIGGMPAAVLGDLGTCVGPPDSIILGAISVLAGGKPIARLSDNCAHGGMITVGIPTVLIGESGSGSSFAPAAPGILDNVLGYLKNLLGIEQKILAPWQVENAVTNIQALADARLMMAIKKGELIRWNDQDKINVAIWMGDSSEKTRQLLLKIIDKQNSNLNTMGPENFEKGPKPEDWSAEDWDATYAYVYPDDQEHKIHVGPNFERSKSTGSDSKADTIVHENSHFNDVAGTNDEPMNPNDSNSPTAYGKDNCSTLASTDPDRAKKNADNFSYYVSN